MTTENQRRAAFEAATDFQAELEPLSAVLRLRVAGSGARGNWYGLACTIRYLSPDTVELCALDRPLTWPMVQAIGRRLRCDGVRRVKTTRYKQGRATEHWHNLDSPRFADPSQQKAA